MERWHDAGAVGEIAPGGFGIVETDEVVAAVFNIDGEFWAVEDVCSHDGAELAGGPVEDHQVICPRHGARFCLKTGRALTPPAYEDIRTFPVRVRDGRVEVALPD